jgi:hypothetical protein
MSVCCQLVSAECVCQLDEASAPRPVERTYTSSAPKYSAPTYRGQMCSHSEQVGGRRCGKKAWPWGTSIPATEQQPVHRRENGDRE